MRKMVKKQKPAKKCFAAALTLLLIFTMVFGNVFETGKLGDVYAGSNDRYVIAEDYGYGNTIEECTLHDEDFEADGTLTIEFRGVDNRGLFYQIDGKGKPYINSKDSLLTNEYYYITYFILNRERAVKCDYSAKVLTVNKSDFKKKSEGLYELAIGSATNDAIDQWYMGLWFDKNGENTYAPSGTWKGSGDSQWFEDTSGWYPYSQWMKADKYYPDYNAYKYKSDAAQMSGAWGKDDMLVSSAWFYFDSNGYAIKSGWHQIDGYWYYFDNFLYEGYCWRDGYYINGDGTQTYSYTGSWCSDANGWWFADSSGWYPANQSQIIDGETYYFKADGYLATDMWLAPGPDYNTPGEAGNSWSCWLHVNSSGIVDKQGEYDENGKWTESERNL